MLRGLPLEHGLTTREELVVSQPPNPMSSRQPLAANESTTLPLLDSGIA
jgi:hypothetical protein